MTRTEVYKELALMYPNEIIHPLDELIDLVGLDPAFAIVEKFTGTNLYIPAYRKMFQGCLQRHIISEFDGGNYAALARKYGFCERSIRKIVNE